MPSHRPLSAALLAAVALAAAACGSSSGPPAPTTTSTTRAASTTSTTGAPTTTSSTPGPTTTTTARAAGCTLAQLSVSAGQSGAGLGHIGVPIVFRNTSTATCTLYGYPGVAGLDAQGTQVVQAQRTPAGYLGGLPPGTTEAPVVPLAPGQSASAMVEGTDVQVGTAPCAQYPALLVTPPDLTQSVHVTATLPGCSPIEVHPVVPGITGSPE